MDDFTVYGKTFDHCLENLDRVLQRCEEKHLILNWEKCHFMVQEGIVLGHKVFERGIEVDKAKIEVILKNFHLPRMRKESIAFWDMQGSIDALSRTSLKLLDP